MSLAHPSELLAFLKDRNLSPRKSLSQNFIIDANVVRKMVSLANIQSSDTVLEIGPGPGALTQELLQTGARVIAVETDSGFAEALSRLKRDDRLIIEKADFLSFPLKEKLQRYAPLKIVSNLPYHISSPILEHICDEQGLFSCAFVMLQKELVDRALAHPSSKEMSSFTIFLNTYAEIRLAMNVSRNCFYPKPKVDSSVLELQFHPPFLANPAPFLNLIRKAFQQRRKMLRSSIGITLPQYATMRPEMLSFADWRNLWDSLNG